MIPLKVEPGGRFPEVACQKDRTAPNGQVSLTLVEGDGDLPILAVAQRRLLTSKRDQRPVPAKELGVRR
jgi:hypothetical protein